MIKISIENHDVYIYIYKNNEWVYLSYGKRLVQQKDRMALIDSLMKGVIPDFVKEHIKNKELYIVEINCDLLLGGVL